MKMIIALVLFSVLHIEAHTFAQTLTISKSNVHVTEVFREIKKQTGNNIICSSDILDTTPLVDLEVKNVLLAEVLEIVLSPYGLTYKKENNNIAILRKVIPFNRQDVSTVLHEKNTSLQSVIRGTVTTLGGEPVAGASVSVKGKTVATATDDNGNFEIVANVGETLIFTSIGFVSKEVVTVTTAELNVQLDSDQGHLDEVVVVGYGTQKKSDLTGAVARIDAGVITQKVATANIAQAIQGKIAGVEIVEQGGGVPSGKPLIRIRGTNSINTSNEPLIVVDGIVGVSNALSVLSSDDIESIDVLRDASATAIYGARGANGVVMITTKKGKSGNIRVNLNSNATADVMNRHFYTLNAEQLMFVYEQAMTNVEKYSQGRLVDRKKDFRGPYAEGLSYSEMPWLFEKTDNNGFPVKLIGKDGNYYKPRYNTDWEKEAYSTAISHSHHLDVSGGGEKTNLLLSVGYLDKNGMMLDSYYKRINGRMHGDFRILPNLLLSTNVSVAKSKETKDDGITRRAAETWSIVPIKYPNDPNVFGIYADRWGTNSNFNTGEEWHNPVFYRNEDYGLIDKLNLFGSFALVYELSKNFTVNSNFSYDIAQSKDHSYSGKKYGGQGRAQLSQDAGNYWQFEGYVNYKTKLINQDFNAMVGLSWSENDWANMRSDVQGFFDNFYGWHNMGVGQQRPVVGSSDGKSSLNSYFARLNYSIDSKYLFTATGRYDGSSKFGKNSKFGFFPSGGFAWNAHNEDFFNSQVVNTLKLRTSWGKTGNQEIGSYVTQSYLGTTNVVFGDNVYTGLYPNSVGNSDLKWETNEQIDLGLELGFLNNRIMFEADLYKKTTSDMLLDVPLPRSSTTGTVKLNYGSLENKGVELKLQTSNVEKEDFSWNSTLVFAVNKNKITKLGPNNADIFFDTGAGNGTRVLRVGHSVGSFFGLNRLGVYSTMETALAARYGMLPGDLKFEDRDNDGKINLIADGVILGSAFPKWTATLNNGVKYKNFDLAVDVRFVYGQSKASINESAEDRQLVSGGKNTVVNAWRPDHQNTMIAQIRPGGNGGYYQSFPDSHMIEDASFIRGQNLILGYTLKNRHFEKIRIYGNVQNFFLITKATGYDPEGSSLDKMDPLAINIDKYQYPKPTSIILGLNLTF